MTTLEKIKSDNGIRIPFWLLSILIPVILAVLTAFTVQVRQQQDFLNNIQNHETRITKVEDVMVTRGEMDDLKTTLLRLEDKVDRLIERR